MVSDYMILNAGVRSGSEQEKGSQNGRLKDNNQSFTHAVIPAVGRGVVRANVGAASNGATGTKNKREPCRLEILRERTDLQGVRLRLSASPFVDAVGMLVGAVVRKTKRSSARVSHARDFA